MTSGYDLSIVVPVYNGAASVGLLVEALARLPGELGLEIILVNDGSEDNSLALCRALAESATVPITVIDLSRNFGEHNAVMAGLTHAQGAYVITMDDDLQNAPEDVTRLYDHARGNDYDVVYTFSARHRQNAWRRLGSRFANWCADRLMDKPKGLYLSSFRCMSAFAVTNILRFQGPYPYIDGLLMQVTRRIGRIEVAHLPRAGGESRYTLRRLVRLWLAMFLGFSLMPLRAVTLVGGILAIVGLILIAAGDIPAGGALPVVVLLIGTVLLVALGIIGELVGRLFLAANGKPQFIIRSVTRGGAGH